MINERGRGGGNSGWLSHDLVEVEGRHSRQGVQGESGLRQEVDVEVTNDHSGLQLPMRKGPEEILEFV